MFTKKHYKVIARAMYSTQLPEDWNQMEMWDRITVELTELFSADNHNFNKALFIKACNEGILYSI